MKLKKWFCFDIWCFKSQVLQILVVEPYTFIPGTLKNLGPEKTRFLGIQVSWPSYFWFSNKLKCSNVRFRVGFLFLKTFLHKEISMSKTQFSGNDQNMSEIFPRLLKEFLYNLRFVTKIGGHNRSGKRIFLKVFSSKPFWNVDINTLMNVRFELIPLNFGAHPKNLMSTARAEG